MHTLDNSSTRTQPNARQAGERAQEFRTILSARRAADAILADAADVRHHAGLQADLLVAEAEALSSDLTDQARSVLDRARASADDVRRSAHAQVVTDREAFQAEMDSARLEHLSSDGRAGDQVLADLEDTVRTLAATLQQARDSVADAEGTIDLLRAEISGTPSGTPSDISAPSRVEPPEERVEPRPLGWLFRAERS